VLDQFELMLTPPVRWGLMAMVVALVAGAVFRRLPARRDLAVVGMLIVGAGLWVAEVALMTSDGFSGNIRYLIMPAALVCLVAGIGVGWLARAVLGRYVAGTTVLALALAAVIGVKFAEPARETLRADIDAVTFQARMSDQVAGLVARAGGPARVRACGDIYTGPFQVPLVAWNMRLHTTQVSSLAPIRPAVVFRTRPVPGARPYPPVRSLGDPTDLDTLSVASGWRIVGACRGAA
jgi:hypothetical protein